MARTNNSTGPKYVKASKPTTREQIAPIKGISTLLPPKISIPAKPVLLRGKKNKSGYTFCLIFVFKIALSSHLQNVFVLYGEKTQQMDG